MFSTLRRLVLCVAFCLPAVCCPADKLPDAAAPTARQLVELIIRKTGVPALRDTVDTFKAGNPETPVRGVAVCMFGSMDVLRQAVAEGCNFVIVHEPVFYNHTDSVANLSDDPVYREKKRFIDEHALVIWRFHDYLHSIKPDPVLTGMSRKLGWPVGGDPAAPSVIILPETTLQDVLSQLRRTFGAQPFHVVGDLGMKLTRVVLLPGAPGGPFQCSVLARDEVELVIAGEAPQWETYEYVRDAVQQGRRKAIVFIGHALSEEAGVECGAEWLRQFIQNVPVRFISSGPAHHQP
jgi:putative NIF3 family GTP cyclohydrolase 1 type 2